MDPMTTPNRIYKHSSAGTDSAALLLGGGLGLTLALQFTTVISHFFKHPSHGYQR